MSQYLVLECEFGEFRLLVLFMISCNAFSHNSCVLREARWVPLPPSAQSCIIFFILTRFIGKSNAFLQFYRKNQCVSLFETKTKVFSQTTNRVLPTSCRGQVWTYSSSLLPTKSNFQPAFLGILPTLQKCPKSQVFPKIAPICILKLRLCYRTLY